MDKITKEKHIEKLIPHIREHSITHIDDGWLELIETYTDDDIFNTLYANGILNIDDVILFFYNRFNPTTD